MNKARYVTSISLNETDNARVEELKKYKYTVKGIFNAGITALEEQIKLVEQHIDA